MLGQRDGHGGRLQAAELRFPGLHEDVGDRRARSSPPRRRRCPGSRRRGARRGHGPRSTSPRRAPRRARPRGASLGPPRLRADRCERVRPPGRRIRSHRSARAHCSSDSQPREVSLDVAAGLGHAVAAELLQHGIGHHERHHRLGDDARRPGPRTRPSAGCWRGPPRRWRRRRCAARAGRSRSASWPRGRAAARRCSCRPRSRLRGPRPAEPCPARPGGSRRGPGSRGCGRARSRRRPRRP